MPYDMIAQSARFARHHFLSRRRFCSDPIKINRRRRGVLLRR